jgi:hypothetical protein
MSHVLTVVNAAPANIGQAPRRARAMSPQHPGAVLMNVAEVRREFHELREQARGLREANMALRSKLVEHLAGLEDMLARAHARIARR